MELYCMRECDASILGTTLSREADMRKLALFSVVLVSLLVLGCGGGAQTTPTPAIVAAVPFEVTINDTELLPHTITLTLGKTYKAVVHNTGLKARKFRIPKWDITVNVEPDKTEESATFVVQDATSTACFEESRASREEFRCEITVATS